MAAWMTWAISVVSFTAASFYHTREAYAQGSAGTGGSCCRPVRLLYDRSTTQPPPGTAMKSAHLKSVSAAPQDDLENQSLPALDLP